MDNNSKREAIEKFNIKGRLFNILILEENGKFILHLGGKEGSVYKKESLPKFVPDFVDEVVYEQNWKLFLKSRKMNLVPLRAERSESVPAVFCFF